MESFQKRSLGHSRQETRLNLTKSRIECSFKIFELFFKLFLSILSLILMVCAVPFYHNCIPGGKSASSISFFTMNQSNPKILAYFLPFLPPSFLPPFLSPPFWGVPFLASASCKEDWVLVLKKKELGNHICSLKNAPSFVHTHLPWLPLAWLLSWAFWLLLLLLLCLRTFEFDKIMRPKPCFQSCVLLVLK